MGSIRLPLAVGVLALAALQYSPLVAQAGLAYPAAALSALSLLIAPGWLLHTALGNVDSSRLGNLSVWFTLSLALLIPSMLVPLAQSGPLSGFAPSHALLLVGLTIAAILRTAVFRLPTALHPLRFGPAAWVAILALVALTALAWELTSTGSIDRWWYLAYVRNYLTAPELTLEEPFLGSGQTMPRFGFHIWLLAMAGWSAVSSLDPVWIYEKGAPLLLIPTAFSASLYLARATLGSAPRTIAFAVAATGLLWAGSLYPVVTRIPEDKILAICILVPVVVGATLRAVNLGKVASFVVLAGSAVALASTHALIYAFALITLLPCTVLAALPKRRTRQADEPAGALSRRQFSRRPAIVSIAILLLGAGAPLATGAQTHGYLRSVGATASSSDHPVIRVHQGRARLVQVGRSSYLVHPRLLAHPIQILALLSLPLLRRRRGLEREYLWTAAVIPLLLAFVPPLARLLGSATFPWMVYRILWVVPYAPLAALGAEALLRRFPRREAALAAGLALICLPTAVSAMSDRLRSEREERTQPDDPVLRQAFRVITALPRESILAASPEISERLPALTGRRVLAGLDRSTIVFSGSRSVGEARLTARASLMNGIWKRRAMAPDPTHLLVESESTATRYCGQRLLRESGLTLCEFRPVPKPKLELLAPISGHGRIRLSIYDLLSQATREFTVRCDPEPELMPATLIWGRPGPWSIQTPGILCHVHIHELTDKPRPLPRTLTLTPFLGRAVEEFHVVVEGRRNGEVAWRQHGVRRVHTDEALRFQLPGGQPMDLLEIAVTPRFLPFVKLRDIRVSFDRAQESATLSHTASPSRSASPAASPSASPRQPAGRGSG